LPKFHEWVGKIRGRGTKVRGWDKKHKKSVKRTNESTSFLVGGEIESDRGL